MSERNSSAALAWVQVVVRQSLLEEKMNRYYPSPLIDAVENVFHIFCIVTRQFESVVRQQLGHYNRGIRQLHGL